MNDDAKNTKKWYIVHVYSNFESKIANTILERAAAEGFADRIDEVLVPMESMVELRNGKRVQTERKFFPGYILIKAAMDETIYHVISRLPRVTGFLGTQDTPIPVPEDEINRLKGQIREGIGKPKPIITFQIGEQVRVSDGPFASFNGLVEDIDEARARLKVAVLIFGRATPVELEYSQVQKL